MRLAILRIQPRETAGGYPLALFVEKPGDAAWQDVPVATGVLPDDLGAPSLGDAWGIDSRDDVVRVLREQILGADRGGDTSQRIGEHLYSLLASGELADRWDDLEAEPTRVALEVLDEDLQGLPWELVRRGPAYVFADETSPWFRLTPKATLSSSAPQVEWSTRCPLRVLIVVGSDEADKQVRAEEEVRAILRAIAGVPKLPVEWHVERRPTYGRLRDVLRWTQPHVLHFIGHSSTVPGGEDSLRISTPDGGWEYTTSLVASDLAVAKPTLVVLNACRLGSTHTYSAQAEGVWTLARVYRAKKVPAIVAMQGDVQGDDASRFATALWEGLLKRALPIDAAVAMARLEIDASGLRDRDFGFPTLTLACRPEEVLPLPEPQLDMGVLEHIRTRFRTDPFVDRCEERRVLADQLGAALDATGSVKSVLLSVVGSSDVGKSWLVRWCLYVRALLGKNVAYVDLRESRGHGSLRTPLEVLGDIRDALVSCPTHGQVNAQHLDGVALTLEHGDADPHEATVGQFRDALSAAASATGGTLVIALDHIDDASSQFRDTIGRHLLGKVADGKVPGVCVVVARNDDDEHRKRWPFATDAGETIQVGTIEPADAASLAASCVYYLGGAVEQGKDMSQFMQRTGEPQTMRMLKAVGMLVRDRR